MKRDSTRLAQLLAERKISMPALAAELGLSVRTVHNIACGNCTSRTARQKITNLLGLQLWPDVPVTARYFTYRAGTAIEFVNSPRLAKFHEAECGDRVRREGNTITFLMPVTFAFEVELEGTKANAPVGRLESKSEVAKA